MEIEQHLKQPGLCCYQTQIEPLSFSSKLLPMHLLIIINDIIVLPLLVGLLNYFKISAASGPLD
jgi:hypothetical protein